MVFLSVHSLPFSIETTAFRSHDFGRNETRVLMQPAAQHDVFRKAAGFLRQIREHYLRYVLRPMRVAARQTERGRIDQIDVAKHQFPECGFRSVPGELRE